MSLDNYFKKRQRVNDETAEASKTTSKKKTVLKENTKNPM